MPSLTLTDAAAERGEATLLVVTDRLTAGSVTLPRLRDSLETAFAKGGGSCHAWVLTEGQEASEPGLWRIDGRVWRRLAFHAALRCEDCGRDYPTPEPRLYDYNSPLGACPQCEGFGDTVDVDMDLVVPDGAKSIREGAIAPWNTPAYAHELQELLALADDYGIPVDVPFSGWARSTCGSSARAFPNAVSAACGASSTGWSGTSTRCTSASFWPAGAVIGPAPGAAAGGCATRPWRRASAARTWPNSAA